MKAWDRQRRQSRGGGPAV